MGETTAISWCDHTFNPWLGCQKVSPACDGCYAENLMDRRMGRVQWGGPGRGAGTRVRTSEHTWNDPVRWNRKAEKLGTRPFVFCASLADIFDNAVPAQWRRDAFDVMRRTPRLVYLLLSKRPQNIVRLTEEAGGLPPNCALGTTVEDQERAINLFHLSVATARLDPLFTFGSFEPLLGPVDVRRISVSGGIFDALEGGLCRRPLRWIITGGETDQGAHKARPTHPDWFRSLRDQAAAAGVPFHHKQNGEWIDAGHWYSHHPTSLPLRTWTDDGWTDDGAVGGLWLAKAGKVRAGRLLHGVLHNARPTLPATLEAA